MRVLLSQLGINWMLLLSQGVNFFILLVVLTLLVYRPLIRAMAERKKRIELGLRGAEEVESRLTKIDLEKTQIITQAEKSAVDIIGSAEIEGKKRIQESLREADKKAGALLEEAKAMAERKRIEELHRVAKEARALVKEALVKTVELDPKAIDETLIDRAVSTIKKMLI